MKPLFFTIQQQHTGQRIKALMAEKGYSVKDIQMVMGFENPQAVYKWLSGKSLPSLDNFLILSRILGTSIESILVIDEDAASFKKVRLSTTSRFTASQAAAIIKSSRLSERRTTMTAIINSVSCQKQQKERAYKQRFVVMPLEIGEKGWKFFGTA